VERLLDAVGRSERPSERRARSQAERDIVLAEVLGKLSPKARLEARVTLRYGPAAARHLELGKTSFLIALDGARAAARAIGDGLVADGVLAARDDVFLLLPSELLAAAADPGALGELVAERRDARARHMVVDLPATWTGQPQPMTTPALAQDDIGVVAGAGVSAGIVEGRVCVVMDPADDVDIELGDILVAPTTDPSWVSLMTVAGGLVIDIGTTASHGAIIARELGVPCVIGTGGGTRVLRDGDLVRVDGAHGTVDVLARHTPEPTPARNP
jgi:pyruvate,water dikinase